MEKIIDGLKIRQFGDLAVGECFVFAEGYTYNRNSPVYLKIKYDAFNCVCVLSNFPSEKGAVCLLGDTVEVIRIHLTEEVSVLPKG